MFLSSSFANVANLFVSFTKDQWQGKTITFIATASLPEEVVFYVAEGRKALENQGLFVDDLEISTATREEITKKLRNNDAIYVSGGNTFFLLQELRRAGADKLIVEQINAGKLYVGESAGAIILSKNIGYVKDMDDFKVAAGLQSFDSLGVVDFYPLPHYTNFPFKEAVEKIISDYTDKIDLCPISNSQAIVVVGNNFEVLGK